MSSSNTPRIRPRTSTHLDMTASPSASMSDSATLLQSRSPPVRRRFPASASASEERMERRRSGYIPSMDSPSPMASSEDDQKEDEEDEGDDKVERETGPPRYSYIHPQSPAEISPERRSTGSRRASSEPPQMRETNTTNSTRGGGLRIPFIFNLRRPTLETREEHIQQSSPVDHDELMTPSSTTSSTSPQTVAPMTNIDERGNRLGAYPHGIPLSAISEAPSQSLSHSQTHSHSQQSQQSRHAHLQESPLTPSSIPLTSQPSVNSQVDTTLVQQEFGQRLSTSSNAPQFAGAGVNLLRVPGQGGPGSPTGSQFTGMSIQERLSHQGSRVFTPAEADAQGHIAGEAPPLNFHDLVQIYQVVADRRASFDSLLWQVPTMGLTAHAFLFSIGLASDTSQASRIISMALVLLITFLTIHLFTRQLQAEDADNRWLEDFEKRHHLDPIDSAHGSAWGKYRSVLPHRARQFKHLARLRGFTVWSNGLLAIGLVGLAVMLLAIGKPDLLIGCSCDQGSGRFSKRSLCSRSLE